MEFKPYDPKAIEPKWQKRWADSHVFEAKNDYTMPKFYGLIEFPYPSGQGLHVGHPRSNTAMDIIARKRRMEGCNVLFPIGWDAFGLPTENYAIKNKVHPAIVTKKNIDHFREQLQKIGFSFDYSREVNTTDPSYYRWTQWIFLQLFKHGLAYMSAIMRIRPSPSRINAITSTDGSPSRTAFSPVCSLFDLMSLLSQSSRHLPFLFEGFLIRYFFALFSFSSVLSLFSSCAFFMPSVSSPSISLFVSS